MPVSVVIPAYNAARLLPHTLRSIAAQSRRPAEVIVVDDGSSDATVDVARRMGARVIPAGGNQGPWAARNLGLRAAAHPLVAFVDADDVWEPDHLALVAGSLDRHRDAVLAFARIQQFVDDGHDGTASPPLWVSPPVERDDVPFDAIPRLLRRNIVPQSTVVVRRAALLEAGGYDTSLRYSEDYDLWLRLALDAPFVARHAVTCRYRLHEQQATAGSSAKVARTTWLARDRILRALETRGRENGDRQPREQLKWVYHAELRDAYRAADRDYFDALLALEQLAPDGSRIARRWRVGRVALPLWAGVKAVARLVR